MNKLTLFTIGIVYSIIGVSSIVVVAVRVNLGEKDVTGTIITGSCAICCFVAGKVMIRKGLQSE